MNGSIIIVFAMSHIKCVCKLGKLKLIRGINFKNKYTIKNSNEINRGEL